MKNILTIAIFAVLLLSNSFADTKSQKQTQEQKPVYGRDEILGKVDEIYNALKSEKEDNPILPTKYTSYTFQIQRYIDYPDLEKKTNIHRDWFVKINKILKAMEECKTKQEIAKMNNDKELYLKAKQFYQKCFEAFEETYKNPIKIKVQRTSGGR